MTQIGRIYTDKYFIFRNLIYLRNDTKLAKNKLSAVVPLRAAIYLKKIPEHPFNPCHPCSTKMLSSSFEVTCLREHYFEH